MTVDPEMLKILKNLENAEQLHEQKQIDRAQGKAVVSEDSQEMYNILKRLEDATTNVAQTINEQKDVNPVTAVGMKSGNTITMNGYSLHMEKGKLTEKYTKTFYTIKHGDDVLHKDLGLFESAMAILKKLIERKSGISKIVELDDRYLSHLTEAAYHKARAKTITESVKHDVAIAKHSSAMDKASDAKREIKRLI